MTKRYFTELKAFVCFGSVLCLLLVVLLVWQRATHSVAGNRLEQARANYANLSLRFEANQGQAAEPTKFLARGQGYSFYLTPTAAIFNLEQAENSKESGQHPRHSTLRMNLIGANQHTHLSGTQPLAAKSNYLLGSDRRRWRTDILNYAAVRYEQVYPGVDCVFYGNQQQLEYDFEVAPGADPNRIRLRFEGAEQISLDEAGDLVLRTAAGEIKQRQPVIYQMAQGVRREIAGRYAIKQTGEVGFELGQYDTALPLVIDPTLVYSTAGMGGVGIAADSNGNAYVVGTTNLADFPLKDPLQNRLGGIRDVFVAKLNSTGTALIYSTYLGGEGADDAAAIAVDNQGAPYLTGSTESANFPGAGSRSRTDSDAFVAKLNPAGSGVVYARYLGGSNLDFGKDLAVDGAGQVYLLGETASPDFPISPNALKSVLPAANPPLTDAFLTKLNAAGGLSYSTYLGGSDNELAKAIALDAQGGIYVMGTTSSTDFPVKGGWQTSPGTAFVTKLNLSLSGPASLVYSFTLRAIPADIAVDSSGSPYLLLESAIGLSTTANAFQTSGPGYLAKLTPSGTEPSFATFLGGTGSYTYVTINGTFTTNTSDRFAQLAVDAAGNTYVTGMSDIGTRFMTTADALQQAPGGCFTTPHMAAFGCEDAIVMKFGPTGALVYSSFLGGGSGDFGRGIAVGAGGAIYLTGEAGSNFPTTPNALPQATHRAFTVKLNFNTPGAIANVSSASYTGNELAPDSIVAAFGEGLSNATQAATTTPLPTTLAGTTVKVKDSAGVERLAPLFFVSSTQVNYQIPPNTALGMAQITITSGDGKVSNASVPVVAVAPGLFAANANAQGVASGVIVRVKTDGAQNYEDINRYDSTSQRYVALPIEFRPDTSFIVLALFGTGWRYRSAQTATTVTIGGVNAPIQYVGEQPAFIGLDQINVELPRSLIGRGDVNVVVTVDGKPANTVRINVK